LKRGMEDISCIFGICGMTIRGKVGGMFWRLV
jgi:hypothetical protein